MDAVAEFVSALLILCGALLALTASIGVLRFPDVFTRMHAATKPPTLGLFLVLLRAAIELRDSVDTWMVGLACIFQLLTAPLNAHLVSRMAYRRGNVRHDLLSVDEFREVDKHIDDPFSP